MRFYARVHQYDVNTANDFFVIAFETKRERDDFVKNETLGDDGNWHRENGSYKDARKDGYTTLQQYEDWLYKGGAPCWYSVND